MRRGLIDIAYLKGWIPARVSWQEGEPLIDWCYLGERRFSEPRFNDTLNKCIELPFNLLFRHQTSMDALRQRDQVHPGLKPTGFIFHLSRSGATEVSEMLAVMPASIVLSEARPIDSILRARWFQPLVSDEQRIEWLRLLISNLAQPGRGERHLFIKFDSWSIFDLPIIRKAFPLVPWIFVYRDPVEVLVSHFNQTRGALMIPGVIDPAMFGIDNATLSEMEPETYCAKVLKAICEAALRLSADGGLLINDSQLPGALETISSLFGLPLTQDEMKAIEVVTTKHSKNSSVPFRSDSASNKKAYERLREAARTWAYPAYNALEEARFSQSLTTLDACDLSAAVRS